MANSLAVPAPDRLLLHGVITTEAAEIIGLAGAEFAGVPVRAVKGGEVSALVSLAPPPARMPLWLSRTPKTPKLAPLVSALASLMPMLPVAPGTIFGSEESLSHMLRARESELFSHVADHASLVECEIHAGFDIEAAEEDLITRSPLAALRGETDSEQALIERSVKQSIVGRQAMFLARLNRLIDGTLDMLPLEPQAKSESVHRRVLIARDERAAFRAALVSLAQEVGQGAWIRVGPYLPPINFRRLEISSADTVRVTEARAALGVDEVADRSAIRIAYQRTIERCYPLKEAVERRQRLSQLEQLFGLLNLVAEGQIRAAHGADTAIRFDADALKATWLLRLHTPALADHAA